MTASIEERNLRQLRLFEAIASTTPDFLYAFGLDFRFIYANRRLLEVWGKSFDEAVGRSLDELGYPPWHVEMHLRELRQVIETKKPIKGVVPFTGGSGISGVYEYIFNPVLGQDGQVEIIIGTTRDVTQRQQNQTVREQLEMVVKGANVGVWYCPLPFDRLMWDEKVKEHFHLPPDADVTIDTFYERLHPDDRQRTRLAIEESINQHQSYDIDYRTVSPDGSSVKWIRAMGRGFYDSAGQPTRFDGITIDVTARMHAEERLRAESNVVETSNRVGRSLAAELDLGKLVQIITDATTQLTGAQFGAFFYNVINDKGESYSLYTLSGVDRSNFDKFPMPRNTEIFAPTFNGEGVVRLDDVTTDPRYGRNAPRHGMPEGHLPVRSYLAVPVVSRTGEVLGGLFYGHSEVGVFTERSERIVAGIAAQAAIAIDNARLYESARRLNAEKDKLLESERAARIEVERASRMKDEFLATLSHELRTPLNAILGWSQILRHNSKPEDIEEGVQVIERNARVQTQIIEDLLDMSRIISGKFRLDVQRTNLADVVKAAVETVMPAADARGVRIQTVLDPVAGPVSGDPSRLQQVFWNLLTNAVKFTPRGGRVQVVLERVNSHLEVSVIDTGEGIDESFLPHVFDRFRQADATTTRRHGGLGLGLAIVKQLVEVHGGSVRVKSGGVGSGSTFTVALPLTVLHADPQPDTQRRHPEVGAAPVLDETCMSIEGVKVLVVDDEPDARHLVKRLLEDCKAAVTTAASAREALDTLKTSRPDILVSDIGMPGEDGYSLIRKVRELPASEGGNIPAIALTAYARAEDRMKAVLAGFELHVVKPVESAELIAMIASLAKRARR